MCGNRENPRTWCPPSAADTGCESCGYRVWSGSHSQTHPSSPGTPCTSGALSDPLRAGWPPAEKHAETNCSAPSQHRQLRKSHTSSQQSWHRYRVILCICTTVRNVFMEKKAIHNTQWTAARIPITAQAQRGCCACNQPHPVLQIHWIYHSRSETPQQRGPKSPNSHWWPWAGKRGSG